MFHSCNPGFYSGYRTCLHFIKDEITLQSSRENKQSYQQDTIYENESERLNHLEGKTVERGCVSNPLKN